jgi:hypothetical protein
MRNISGRLVLHPPKHQYLTHRYKDKVKHELLPVLPFFGLAAKRSDGQCELQFLRYPETGLGHADESLLK